MNRSQIENLIPHRDPFLWVDEITELEPGKRCVAIKRVDPAEPFFAGHFPGKPIVPGVFLIEAVAQTSGVMLGAAAGESTGSPRLGAVNRFKFLKAVAPGAILRIETTKLTEAGAMACIEGIVRVGGEVVARGELTVVSVEDRNDQPQS